MQYVFGPVTSSRLGRSLGLDLLGERVCSMDCLYCEVGKTDDLTLERAEYVAPDAILAELRQWRGENELALDHVTLGGMGEPCLNSALPAIVHGAREICPDIPVAVLTNSTLLPDPAVRAELLECDVILPSLDSLVQREYRAINRPVAGITASDIADGLLKLREEFTGKIYLEILLAAGINDSDENFSLLREYVKKLRPDRVDVVTLSRPGTAPGTKGVDKTMLARWREAMGKAGAAPNGTRLRHQGLPRDMSDEAMRDAILASLARRPQTAPQLASAMGANPEKIKNTLATLCKQGHIRLMHSGDAAHATPDTLTTEMMDGDLFFGPMRT